MASPEPTAAEKLLQQTLAAIKSGRSEPLYIMRDAIQNYLEDNNLPEVQEVGG